MVSGQPYVLQFSDKALCFSQSVGALYGNVILNIKVNYTYAPGAHDIHMYIRFYFVFNMPAGSYTNLGGSGLHAPGTKQ